MKIHEYQAKALLARHGVPVPRGEVAFAPQEVPEIAKRLGTSVVVVKAQPRALLAKAEGITLTEMNECEACCGFGGTFAVKYGEISTHIADRKCENIKDSGADAVVLGDLGCMLNIEGRLRRRGDDKTQVLHIAEVLAGPEET